MCHVDSTGIIVMRTRTNRWKKIPRKKRVIFDRYISSHWNRFLKGRNACCEGCFLLLVCCCSFLRVARSYWIVSPIIRLGITSLFRKCSCDIAMSFTNAGPLQFLVEWFDAAPKLKRQYILKYYTDGSKNLVEMIDIKAKKIFLKKCPCPPEVTLEDIYIGSKFLLFSRELEVVDYGDSATRSQCQFQLQPSTVILGTGIYQYWGLIIDNILSAGLQISDVRTVFVTDNMAEDICDELEVSQRQRGGLVTGPCLVISTQGEDGVRNLFETCQQLGSSLDLSNPEGTIFCASSGVECPRMATQPLWTVAHAASWNPTLSKLNSWVKY